MESSPLTEVGSLNSRSESKGDTPDSQRSQGEHSLLASFGDTVIGGITKKLGNFKLGFGNKQKRTSVTPENPPDQDFNKFQETATTKVNPENQEIGIDFSHVQVPSNMSQQQTDSHSWSTGAQFGEGFYEETPFRPSKDLRTGFTDPQFQSRLPRSFYEENAEDFSEVDLEVREQIRTGTRPKTKIGLTDTDDYQKAKNAVTQYKSMITKLCNRLNGSYKTISSAQITKELEDIECSLDVFCLKKVFCCLFFCFAAINLNGDLPFFHLFLRYFSWKSQLNRLREYQKHICYIKHTECVTDFDKLRNMIIFASKNASPWAVRNLSWFKNGHSRLRASWSFITQNSVKPVSSIASTGNTRPLGLTKSISK